MFAGSLILAVTLIAFAIWLQFNEQHGWGDEQALETDLDHQYYRRRGRSRRRTNVVIGCCGILILVAAFVGPGPIWIAVWASVLVGLVIVIGLATLDALRTHRYQRAKLRDLVSRRDSSGLFRK